MVRAQTDLAGLLLQQRELLDGGRDVVLVNEGGQHGVRRQTAVNGTALGSESMSTYLGQLLGLGNLLVSLLAEVLLGLQDGVGHDGGCGSVTLAWVESGGGGAGAAAAGNRAGSSTEGTLAPGMADDDVNRFRPE